MKLGGSAAGRAPELPTRFAACTPHTSYYKRMHAPCGKVFTDVLFQPTCSNDPQKLLSSPVFGCCCRARPASDERYNQEDWFNIFVLHQNRLQHTQSSKNTVKEEYLARFLDFVVWGHEHECILEAWVRRWGKIPGLRTADVLQNPGALARPGHLGPRIRMHSAWPNVWMTGTSCFTSSFLFSWSAQCTNRLLLLSVEPKLMRHAQMCPALLLHSSQGMYI